MCEERMAVGGQRVFKGDLEGDEKVTLGEFGEECTLTFLECPLDGSRLMRRGSAQVLAQTHNKDKTTRAPANAKWLSSRLKNSKQET